MVVQVIVGDPTRSIVAAVFRDPDHAERAANRLLEQGYRPEEITVVVSETTYQRFKSFDEKHIHVEPEGVREVATDATRGGLVGGTTGIVLGALVALAVPLGGTPLLVGGPLLGGLFGGLIGGLAGGMTGLTEPDRKTYAYEEALREGGVLIAVQVAPGQEEATRDVMLADGGEAVHITGREVEESTTEPTPREANRG